MNPAYSFGICEWMLFSVFINDLPERLKHCRCHLFEDDFQLYKAVHKNSVFADVTVWAKKNKLNAGKTEALIASTSNWVRDVPEVEFYGATFVYEDSVWNLNLIDNHMGWIQQVQSAAFNIFLPVFGTCGRMLVLFLKRRSFLLSLS